MSRRKISSESFSSLGSDYLETSPEEEGECPLSRLCWNGSRSPPGQPEPSAAAAAATAASAAASAAAAAAGARRAQRRRRVNLDSLGESISRLTAPSVSRAEGGRREGTGIGKVGAGRVGRAQSPTAGGRPGLTPPAWGSCGPGPDPDLWALGLEGAGVRTRQRSETSLAGSPDSGACPPTEASHPLAP